MLDTISNASIPKPLQSVYQLLQEINNMNLLSIEAYGHKCLKKATVDDYNETA